MDKFHTNSPRNVHACGNTNMPLTQGVAPSSLTRRTAEQSQKTPGGLSLPRSSESSMASDRQRVLHSSVAYLKINPSGFNKPGESEVIKQAIKAVREGLGAIAPPDNDILIENHKLSNSIMAHTICYGKEALIEFDMEAHKDANGQIDADCLPCVAQTLTHEIFLHAIKEFHMFHNKKENHESRTAKDGHRDACLIHARQEYLDASLRVMQKLPMKQRETFLMRWHQEITELAEEATLGLSEEEKKETISWANKAVLKVKENGLVNDAVSTVFSPP